MRFESREQSLIHPVTFPYLSSGQYSPEVNDPFTSVFDPATLPYLKGFAAGMYSEKRYMTEGLNLLVMAAAFGGRNNGASLLMQQFGNPDYNEQEIGVGYGKSLGKISIGALFHLQRFTVRGLPGRQVLQFGMSSIWHVSEKVYTAIRILNPGIFYSNNTERIHPPSIISMGAGMQASSKVYLGLETRKEEDHPLQMLFSLRFQFAEKFFSRFCWSTINNQPFFSTGWKWKDFRIEAGCSYHLALGPSPSLIFIYQKPQTDPSE